MIDRRRRVGASANNDVRSAHKRKVRKRSNGEIAARAELRMTRELIVVLVQAITDLLACLPKDSRNSEQVVRIEATLDKLQGTLAERKKSWASDVSESIFD
jgi:hypothetical protein